MKSRVRMTQKDLVFGIYHGDKRSPNPGLNIWFRNRYIWPRNRRPSRPAPPPKDPRLQELPFEAATSSPPRSAEEALYRTDG